LLLSTERLIGVHCTHGLNRTGYLICRWVVTWAYIALIAAMPYNSNSYYYYMA